MIISLSGTFFSKHTFWKFRWRLASKKTKNKLFLVFLVKIFWDPSTSPKSFVTWLNQDEQRRVWSVTESRDRGQAEPKDWTPKCHNSGNPGTKWEPTAMRRRYNWKKDCYTIYTWNLFVLYFWDSTLQKKPLYNQKKGHLGSRYIEHMYTCKNTSKFISIVCMKQMIQWYIYIYMHQSVCKQYMIFFM